MRGVGTEACPSAEQIASAVRARLGRDPFSSRAERDIEGSVARVGDHWQARLNVLDSEGALIGSRDLATEAPDCSVLADAVTLAVALTIDPTALLAPPAVGPSVPASAEPLAPAVVPAAPVVPAVPVTPAPFPAPARQPEGTRSSEAPTRRSVGVAASAKGLLSIGVLPRPALGAELSAELLGSSRARLTVGLGFLPEVLSPTERFGFDMTAFALGLCIEALGGRRLALDMCGDLQVGAIHVVVYSPQPARPGERWWLAPRLGSRLRWEVAPPLALDLTALAVLPLLRDEFGIEGERLPVFQSAALGFSAAAGLGVSIP